MVAYLARDPAWQQLDNNDQMASQLAGQGYFVVGGRINPHGHGHVVIIVPGREGRYAIAYWGSLNNAHEAGLGYALDQAWTRHELHEVQFFAIRLPTLTSSK